jgi:hypothetical protein
VHGYISVGDLLLDPHHIWEVFASDPIAFIAIVGFLVVRAWLPKPITLAVIAVGILVWWCRGRLTRAK